MRRLALVALAGLCLYTAEPLAAQGITLGAKAGASFATVGGDDVPDVSTRTGLAIGAMAEIGVSPTFAIQPEVLFVQKGAEQEDPDFGGTATFNFSYVEIPVLAKITVPTAGLARPYLYVGPSASIKTGCSISGESEGVSAELDCENEFFSIPTKSFDLGVIGGVGMGLGMGAGELSFDVRYNLGMSNIMDLPEGEDAASIKNRAFSLMVGYAISLGM